jgi:signal transduction histidine kinase
VALRDGDTWSVAAHEGPIGALSGRRRLNRETAPGRAMVDGEVVQIPDLQSPEADEFQEARELGRRLGFRSALAAPLLRDDVPIGAISLRRPEAGLFTPNQVELLRSFAAQAVIAIENVRLFTELRQSLDQLTAAQANLIQAEKIASLGQLTAGIAHEIKNPLNFINNFASLSSELLDELKQAVTALLDEPDGEKRAELQETMDLLTGNLARIVEHGKRADGIVKSMLSHSRGGTGDWQKSNINALVEEALNLAYHGARAQDKDFNITLTRDLAAEMNVIEVVPQDVTRVFLNLFGNAFYATRKRDPSRDDAGYRPTLNVSTRDLGEEVEIRVRDNGTGIRPEVRAKLFQPFFTTKPTGEGTGLGLSISYDIVTQQHGGMIEVESEPGSYTEFIVRLPRNRRRTQSRAKT